MTCVMDRNIRLFGSANTYSLRKIGYRIDANSSFKSYTYKSQTDNIDGTEIKYHFHENNGKGMDWQTSSKDHYLLYRS